MDDEYLAPPEGTAPLQALRWYMRRIRFWWLCIAHAENRFHANMLRRYPRAAKVVEAILEGLYAVIASPVSALILALLLVSLVISEMTTIIVSLTVFAAWWVLVIAIARNPNVRQLPILRRFLVIVIAAVVFYGVGHVYIGWVLKNYDGHHQESVIPVSTQSPVDIDARIQARLVELFSEEISQIQKQNGDKNRDREIKGPISGKAPRARNEAPRKVSVEDLLSQQVQSLRYFCGMWDDRDRGFDNSIYDADTNEQHLPEPQRKDLAELLRSEKAQADASLHEELVHLIFEVMHTQGTLLSAVSRQTPEDQEEKNTLDSLWGYDLRHINESSQCPREELIRTANYIETLATRVK